MRRSPKKRKKLGKSMFFSFNLTHKYLDNRFIVEENLALQQCTKYADKQKLDFLNCTLH